MNNLMGKNDDQKKLRTNQKMQRKEKISIFYRKMEN